MIAGSQLLPVSCCARSWNVAHVANLSCGSRTTKTKLKKPFSLSGRATTIPCEVWPPVRGWLDNSVEHEPQRQCHWKKSPNQLPLIEKREVRSTFFHQESWILSMIWWWFDAISEANYSANWTWSLKVKSNRISHREPSHSGTLDLLWQSGRSQFPSRAAEQSFTSKTA